MRYSKYDDGGYCLSCVLFARSSDFRAAPGVLVEIPLTSFQKALEIPSKHVERTTAVAFENFMKVVTNKQPSVCHRLDFQKLIVTNRIKIQSIIETIILCGHFTLWSQTAPSKWILVLHGNFWALLES